MSANMMHAETFALLRHVEVNGPRTRPELAKGLQRPEADITKTVNNLVALGYFAKDDTTRPISYALTKKARSKLSQPFTPQPKPTRPRANPEPFAYLEPTPAPALRRKAARLQYHSAYAPPRHQRYGAMATYRACEYQPSNRPGAMDAFALPSRMGDTLHYRDGRVTDMAGNPVTE